MTSAKKAAIARANPQISSNRFLQDNIKPIEERGYATKDSVASLSSPAAYLTALYRAARKLHVETAPLRLDARRPDLQQLILSDSNMNDEVSTLALSNEVLTAAISSPSLATQIAATTWPCDLPYHAPFNDIVSALSLQGKRASELNCIGVNRLLDPDTQSALGLGLSPALHDLLTVSTGKNAKVLRTNKLMEFVQENESDPEGFLHQYLTGLDSVNLPVMLSMLLDIKNVQDQQNLLRNLLILSGSVDEQDQKVIEDQLTTFYGEFHVSLQEVLGDYVSSITFTKGKVMLDMLALDPLAQQVVLQQFDPKAMRIMRLRWVLRRLGLACKSTLAPDLGSYGLSSLCSGITRIVKELDPICQRAMDKYPFPPSALQNALSLKLNSYDLAVLLSVDNLVVRPLQVGDESDVKEQLHKLYGTDDVGQLSQVETLCQLLEISRDRLNQALAIALYYVSGNAWNIGNRTIPVAPSLRGARYVNATLNKFMYAAQAFIMNDGDCLRIYQLFVEAISDASEISVQALPATDSKSMRFFMRYPYPVSESLSLQVCSEFDTEGQHPWNMSIMLPKLDQPQWIDFTVPYSPLNSVPGVVLYFKISGGEKDILVSYAGTFSSIDPISLIRLGKLLRLMKHTQLPPAMIDRIAVLAHPNSTPELDKSTMTALASVQDIMATCNLLAQDALVLAGCDIDDASPVGKVSQFDLLFNTPPLNGNIFTCDGSEINCDPEDSKSTQQRAVLKRAFGVNDTEFNAMVKILTDGSTVRMDLPSVSGLYRISLWASCNGWHPLELYEVLRMLTGSTYAPNEDLLFLFERFCLLADWLALQKLTVAQLDVMTTRKYPEAMTPQLVNFEQSLIQASQNCTDNNYKDKLALAITAAFGLSTNTSRMLEDWFDSIADQKSLLLELKSMGDLLSEIRKPDEEKNKAAIAKCCQVMAQLAVIIKYWNFSAAELELIANQPSALGLNIVLPDINTLRLLSDYHVLVQAAAERADHLLSEIKSNTLSVDALAVLLNVPTVEMQQAAQAAEITSSRLTIADVIAIRNWITSSAGVKVSVAELKALTELKLTDEISVWQKVASAFSATVAPNKMAAFYGKIDEQTSSALCAWYLTHKPQNLPVTMSLTSRDDLFSYLLIDNQNSAKVMTTRIAEATASIQLYIDRCLHGLEEGVCLKTIADDKFFLDWNSINKRYSQWAAIQNLDCYPENYVDPALRILQSGLQRQLVQDLSNGHGMSGDTVEDAFLHYLSGFESLANLSIVSGYHDGLSLDDGYTYFIGNSQASPKDFYWRRLDQAMRDSSGGYLAHSWSFWEKITVPIGNLYKNAIRLVSTKDRLYLLWIEQVQISNPDDQTKPSVNNWHLKLAWENINGSWSVPVTVDLKEKVGTDNFAALVALLTSDSFSFYAANYPEHDHLLVVLHNNRDKNNLNIKSSVILWVSSIIKVNLVTDERDKERLINSLTNDFISHNNTGIDDDKLLHALRPIHDFKLEITQGSLLSNSIPNYLKFLVEPSVSITYDPKNHKLSITKKAILYLSQTLEQNIGTYEVGFDGVIHPLPPYAFYDNNFLNINESMVITVSSEYLDEFDFKITDSNGRIIFKKTWQIKSTFITGSKKDQVYYIKTDNTEHGMYLHQTKDDNKTRLNSQFGPVLVKRIADGIDNLLMLSTQQLKINDEIMDFNGAYGLYFWELFYYSPLLQADHLLANHQFDAAERWINTIFNPQGYIDTDSHASRFWNVLPLFCSGISGTDDLNSNVIDPDVIAQTDPFHYKVHVFMRRLDLLLGKGDSLYRQLDRGALAEAKQCYLTALHLLGKMPDLVKNAGWTDPDLDKAATNDLFRPTLNDKFGNYWKTFEHRLFNLRHNLSLEGQPLHMPMYATPVDPMELYRAANRPVDEASLPVESERLLMHYRYTPIAASARELVAQLSQYGSQLLAIMQYQDIETFNTQAQQQANDLILLSIVVQTKVKDQADAYAKLIAAQETTVQETYNTYDEWLSEGTDSRSSQETQALSERVATVALRGTASALTTLGFGLQVMPNVFGLADGGSNWAGAPFAAAAGIEATAMGTEAAATAHEMTENYRRRAQQWTLMKNESKNRLLEIKEQKNGAQVAQEAAAKQLEYLNMQKEQFALQLNFVKSKSTNSALYQWLKGQLSMIYSQAYELAWSRCKIAEASFKWETGLPTTYVQPIADNSTYGNLLRGERLMAYLQQMDAAYLEWDKRALEITRTVSLVKEINLPSSSSFNQLIKSVLDDTGKMREQGNNFSIELNSSTNELVAKIKLDALKIVGDYPIDLGNIRRIKQIGVSLPALIGPYQDIQAVLSYDFLDQNQSCQRIAISHGIDDAGMFQWSFLDEKYLPFEGININDKGNLVLSFPNATGKQAELVRSLSDIILHIRYTIR